MTYFHRNRFGATANHPHLRESNEPLLNRIDEALPLHLRLKNAVKTQADTIAVLCDLDEAKMLLQLAKQFVPTLCHTLKKQLDSLVSLGKARHVRLQIPDYSGEKVEIESPHIHCLNRMLRLPHTRDVIRPGFMNVSCEKNNDGTGTYHGDGEPDNTSERPPKAIRLPYGDQRVYDDG